MKKVLSITIMIAMLISTMTLFSCVFGSGIPDDLIQLPEAEYKAQCQTYDYKDMMRYPDNYYGKLAMFKGEVVQVLRKGNQFQMRVNVTLDGYYSTDTMYVFYTQKSNENFLEDDIIIMYGELRGTQKYESILGATIEIPRIYVQYIELVSPTPKPTTPSNTDPLPPECTTHIDANTDYICDVCQAQLEKPEEGFTATNDKVYVISTELNVRKTPDTTGNPVGSVLMDQELDRLGYYDNGWSKILYNGEECYVMTRYITESKPITDADFTAADEIVYFTQNAIAWTKPSYIEGYSEKIDIFFAGESVKRTGIATVPYVDEDGSYTFARVEYTVFNNGVAETRVRYVNNAYLTTEASNTDGLVVFEANDEILISKAISCWLRKSTNYIESEIAVEIPQNTVLQAIARGVESDGTVWYKVIYNDQVYYVIYKDTIFDKQ